MNPTTSSLTSTQIEAWILDQLTQRIGLEPAQIERDLPLDSYGVDSVEAVLISADLADWLQMDVDPAIVIDHPTVNGLTHAIAAITSAS